MTLEADQAVQEARFAGACQDQHAGRPAPTWNNLAKANQSCNKPKQVSFLGRKSIKVTGRVFRGLGPQGLGPGPPGPWRRGLQGTIFFVVPEKAKEWETAETAATEVGAWRDPPPAFLGSPLLKPSNTPPKVGGP